MLWWFVLALMTAACVRPHPVTVAAACLIVAALVWVRTAQRRAFRRNLDRLPSLNKAADVEPREHWPRLAVLIPARDEEPGIEKAARSLLSLAYPTLDIWFIDDHSSDRTPQILDRIQGEFPHVHVVHDPPVIDGWFGKSSALWQAFLEVSQHDPSPEWLLFADADVEFEPGILQQAVALAERERLDFLTVMPRLLAKTWAEQLLLPTGWRGILQGADPERMNDPKSFPIGVGAFMLVRHSAYRSFGGHRALAQWHPEDTLMAAAVKQIGGRVGVAWTPDLLRVRFYHGYREVKKNTLRKMRIFFGDHIHLPLTMVALRLSTTLMALPMMAAGIVPQLVAGRFDLVHALLAAAGAVLYVDETREYRGVEKIAEFHPVVPWVHPLSGALRVWFGLSLAWQILARKPMDWRGRQEFGATGEATPPNSR